MFRRLNDRGRAVHTALFPHISDPDHVGLFDIDFPNVTTCRIGSDFRTCERSEESVLAGIADWTGAARPDLIFTCSFNAGPESRLRASLSRLPHRPLVIGLQHGMKHDWPLFERWDDRFDVFGTFGRLFLAECSDRFRRKMVVMGLPKLDAIARTPLGGPVRRILFAGQNEPSPKELAPLLDALAAKLGAEIIVRPHPEHREAFRALAPLFSVQPPSVPLAEALAEADAMITTGSTVALEGLVAGLRVAVLPRQHGDVYQPAGIVAESLAVQDVIAVFNRYDDPGFRVRIDGFLDAATGASGGGRTEIALSAIDRLVGRQVA
ncbi:MAG: hypothetical protein JO328_11360 [Hyphomicrobiales bacterium]|nr:hypothetical protein [Hyphomicrobiales bacterium]MBV8825342.1 hypothetical protein [Hyphomicrobiales bacterium]MBV9429727.1 hypothetical protein [Bradyrhizobiaceae bacterium]